MRSFEFYQPVRVKNVTGGKEKWIPGIIVAVKGLLPDDARGLSTKREGPKMDVVDYKPPILQETPRSCVSAPMLSEQSVPESVPESVQSPASMIREVPSSEPSP